MSFTNKVVIVTGGSSGIGEATAIHFAKEGADVAIVGRNDARLKKVAEQIAKVGKPPLIIKADVSKEAEAMTVIPKTISTFGKLDVLVNNAGMFKGASIIDKNLVKVFKEVMDTNLLSVVVLSNAAAPYLIETKGNIVNISSTAGTSACSKMVEQGFIPYCTSKAGLDHFSRVAAVELAGKGVRVNVVSPGPVETPILERSGLPSNWDAMKSVTALNTITTSDEVASLVLYLASDKARTITGVNYPIDGGVLLKG